jgi:oligopeptide/dipeptide ABC transporter ATP-binding protein
VSSNGQPSPESARAAVPLLEARHLSRRFRVGGPFSRTVLQAVDDASFQIDHREVVALVGESGSGKSTIARLLARVYEPSSGEILLRGRSLAGVRSRKASLAYRSELPMVFQDPFGSLNPAFRVSHGILRSLRLHRPELGRRGRWEEAARLFDAVGLRPADDILHRYPHELSGGQRQRIGFAQALGSRPALILADEPVSMLDVSIRIGLLNLMTKLREEAGVSFLYITHDIASARYVADRIMVMYAGRIVEAGPIEEVLEHPQHPYTQLLLSNVPDPRAPLSVTGVGAPGEPPKVINSRPGCRFFPRCPVAVDRCGAVTPALLTVRPSHQTACHVAQSEAEAIAGRVDGNSSAAPNHRRHPSDDHPTGSSR